MIMTNRNNEIEESSDEKYIGKLRNGNENERKIDQERSSVKALPTST